MKLDAASSLIITFYTPLERCKLLRLPFWQRMCEDIFERKIQAYKNCRDVVAIADGVQVFGNEETTYDRISMKKWNALE